MDVMMTMTTGDIRRLRGHFTKSLSLDAFVQLMKKCLRSRIQSELDFVVGAIELFHTIDVNGDEKIDWDEFTGYMMDAGQAKGEFYSNDCDLATKQFVPLSVPLPDFKTPLQNITTRIQEMRLLTEQNAVAYFETDSDVVYIYGLRFDCNESPRHLSSMRLHTTFQEHSIVDVVYIPTCKALVTSSVLLRGYLSIWNVSDLYNPKMTHRLESLAVQEHLCWIPSLKRLATSAVILPSLHSGNLSDSKRNCYRPNAGIHQSSTTICRVELWDLSGKIRPSTLATKEVVVVQEHLKGVTALVAFRSLNRTYIAVGRQDGILSVMDTESSKEVGTFDAHGSGVKVLVYSSNTESFASVGFYLYTDETSLHITTWKKSSSGKILTIDSTLKQHVAPVELLAFADSIHQLISVDRTETFNVYSSVMRTPTAEHWECLQTFQYPSLSVSDFYMTQHLGSLFVVPETVSSDPILITAGTSVKFYALCEIKAREEIFFAYYCSALNVIIGATNTKVLLWKGDTGKFWKMFEYAAIVLSSKSETMPIKRKRIADVGSANAQAPAITAVCVDDRERKFITGDDTGSVKVVNIVNGNVMKELHPHTHGIVDLSYVLYGKRVISVSSNSVVHICDENNAQGFYVPCGGGPFQSVLLQSLRFLPEVECAQKHERAESAAKHAILRCTGNEALNLLAVLIAPFKGNSFIQVWNFTFNHLQGTCVIPPMYGDVTCISFLGSTADIIGGTSTRRMFRWSLAPGTTLYRCTTELSCLSEASSFQEAATSQLQSAMTHIITACIPDATKEDETTTVDESGFVTKASTPSLQSPHKRMRMFSSRSILPDCLRLEQEYGVYVFASDEAGFVTQWHVCLHMTVNTLHQTDRTLSGTRVHAHRTTLAAYQHEEMRLGFDSITALYHQAQIKYTANVMVPDVVKPTRQWKAHCRSVVSLKIARDPLSIVTSSTSGQVNLWSIDGEPYGVLDPFATRRAPQNQPWKFPVDMTARRQQLETEAKAFLRRPVDSSAKKSRLSILEQRLALTKKDLTKLHERPRSRKRIVRASEVGRAVRNFILKQTTIRSDADLSTSSSACKEMNENSMSLHSVFRELEQLHLPTDGSNHNWTCRGYTSRTRMKKYSIVTLADVLSTSNLRPRTASSKVHCDLTPTRTLNVKRKHENTATKETRAKQGSIAQTKSRQELVDYHWHSTNVATQKERTATSICVDSDKDTRVRRYDVKVAHT